MFIGQYPDERAPLPQRRAGGIVVLPRRVCEIIELTLDLVHPPLQDLNASLGRDADVAPVKIYAARHGLQAPHIIECLTILLKSSFPAFELSPHLPCLLVVPLTTLCLYLP